MKNVQLDGTACFHPNSASKKFLGLQGTQIPPPTAGRVKRCESKAETL